MSSACPASAMERADVVTALHLVSDKLVTNGHQRNLNLYILNPTVGPSTRELILSIKYLSRVVGRCEVAPSVVCCFGIHSFLTSYMFGAYQIHILLKCMKQLISEQVIVSEVIDLTSLRTWSAPNLFLST